MTDLLVIGYNKWLFSFFVDAIMKILPCQDCNYLKPTNPALKVETQLSLSFGK